MSAAYRSLHINTSRERMEYPDFPMPKSYPDFPHHTHIAEYFDAYVDHFGFRDRITFETGVEHAAPAPTARWEVTLDDGGDAPLRRADRRQRPPLGRALARPGVPGRGRFAGRPDPRARLHGRGPGVLPRQARRRARHGQLGDGHRGRGELLGRRDLPRRPPRRVDHPQVRLRPAARPDLDASPAAAPACASAFTRALLQRRGRRHGALRAAEARPRRRSRRTRRSPTTCSRASPTARSRRSRTSRG